jgi:asparagine synthase (glutamine-hydrolysing)
MNGMWSFILYDRAKNLLLCSRDRFGKKPFYYTLQEGTLVFASELSALRHHPLTPSRSLEARAAEVLRLRLHPGAHDDPRGRADAARRPFAHLRPATRELKVWKYWDFVLEPFDSIPANPEEEWGGRLVELLSAAVKRRLMSDVPLGVLPVGRRGLFVGRRDGHAAHGSRQRPHLQHRLRGKRASTSRSTRARSRASSARRT